MYNDVIVFALGLIRVDANRGLARLDRGRVHGINVVCRYQSDRNRVTITALKQVGV